MGETGFYRSPAIFCREEFEKGTFGTFTYAEAQYNHDIRNMEASFRSSGGENWKEFAGIPPFFYPTHSTSMVLSAMPGVYAKKVVAFGFENGPRTDTTIHSQMKPCFYNFQMVVLQESVKTVALAGNRLKHIFHSSMEVTADMSSQLQSIIFQHGPISRMRKIHTHMMHI